MKLKRLASQFNLSRKFCTQKPTNKFKVVIAGACGGTGLPLALMLKRSHDISKLHLYDVVCTDRVAEDLGSVDTPAEVVGFYGPDKLRDALVDANIVVIPASSPLDPATTSEDDLFETNAPIIHDIAKVCVEVCPKAMIAVITNPINSLVPIVAEVFEKEGKFDPKRLFGVTTLDNIRANTFIARAKNLNPLSVYMPVIGGRGGRTAIPLLSKGMPAMDFNEHELKVLTAKLQQEETVAEGPGCRLANAYAAARFISALLKGMRGDTNVLEYAFVRSDVTPSQFFSTPLILGKEGVEKNFGLGHLTKYEQELVDAAVLELQKSAEKAHAFVNERCSS